MASFFVMQKCLQKPTTRNTHPKKPQPQQVYVLVPKNNMFLPKKKPCHGYFSIQKQHQPNPTNHQTAQPPNHSNLHPSSHRFPHPPRNRARNFPDPWTRCFGAGGLKNLVQTKRRPVNSSPAVANGAKEGMRPSTAGDGSGWIWIKWWSDQWVS